MVFQSYHLVFFVDQQLCILFQEEERIKELFKDVEDGTKILSLLENLCEEKLVSCSISEDSSDLRQISDYWQIANNYENRLFKCLHSGLDI